MSPDAPLVSVVMPAYNAAAYVGRAVRSVQAQTMPAWELLLVDDGSADDTPAVVAGFAAADPRVRVLRRDTNGGPAAARNDALRAARAGWVAYLDSDDEYYPDHLARVVAAAGRADVLVFGYDVQESPADPGRAYHYDPAPRRHLLLPFGDVVTPLGVAHRRVLLDRAGLFDERLRFAEDADLWRRLVRAGARVAFIPARSGRYHVRPDSLVRQHDRDDAALARLPTPLGRAVVTTPAGRWTVRVPEGEFWVVKEMFERHEYGGLPPGVLRDPPVVVDVGANAGLFAGYAKLTYHRGAVVHCFEPYPPAAALLRRNVAALGGVHVHPVGLGPRDEHAPLYLNRHNSGANSLRPELVPDPAGQVLVPVRDAAEVWDGLGFTEVDVLKLDAEGAEPGILERLGDRLAGVRAVLAEYHTAADRRRVDALLPGHELVGAHLHEPGRGVVKYVRADLLRRNRPAAR